MKLGAALGEIPAEDVAKIRANATFDIDRILEIEKETRHDVVAFTRAVSEIFGRRKKMGPLWPYEYRCGRYCLRLPIETSQ